MATFDIKMPKLGESITQGTIVSWSIAVGDQIEENDILFDVSTEKVSNQIPSPVGGKVIEILHQEGETVDVGTVVAVISLDGTDEVRDSNAAKSEAPKAQSAPATAAATTSTEVSRKGSAERWYSPVVLEKAKAAKISQDELDSIEGTGFQGRVSKADITRYIETKKGAPAPSPRATTPAAAPAPAAASAAPKVQGVPVVVKEGDKVIPMDPVRKIIADRMTASKHISPHVTNVLEVDVTNLVRWRESRKDDFKKREGVSLTYMTPIIEAVAYALKAFPRVNASVDGYNIIERKAINVGMAVSLPDGNLIVPVIKDADKLSISGIAGAVADLASRSRANKLNPDDITGGTFTITNLGSFKSLFGTPVINQPEVAILGVGVIEKKPAVITTPEGGQAIAIRDKMYLSLSFDHRIVDGKLGGDFLFEIAKYLEEQFK